jgi:quinol monooxygenase YgiN
MIVVRFKVQLQADKVEQAIDAFRDVIAPARATEGVIEFDIARCLDDPSSVIATEVFADRQALDRQESLPQVAAVMNVLEDALVEPPQATIFNVSSSEPHEG